MAKYVTFPLDNVDYGASNMQLWHSTRGSGVFSADGELETAFKSGLTVTVLKGRAWMGFDELKGVIFGNMESTDLTVDIADGLLDRKDYIVIKYDIINNESYLYVKKGVESSDAQPPTLERNNSTAYELAIAEISIPRGTIELNQGLITDKRLDESVCGVMKDGVTSIPTASLQAQWEGWFNTNTTLYGQQFSDWFENTKIILSGDVAGNLLNEINIIKAGQDEANFLPWSNNEKSIESLDVAGMVDGSVFTPQVEGVEPVTDENGDLITSARSYDLVVQNPEQLHDGILESGRYTISSGIPFVDVNTLRTKNKIKVLPNTIYTATLFPSDKKFYNISEYRNNVFKNTISTNANTITFTTTDDTTEINVSINNSDLTTKLVVAKGSDIPIAPRTYNPSKTEFSYPEEYRGVKLPNGANNVVNKNGGLDVEVKKHVLESGDIEGISTSNVNVDIVYTKVESAFGAINWENEAFNTIVKGYNRIDIYSRDNVSSINSYYQSGQRLLFIFAKGTSLAEAQADLTGTEIYYELAEPFTLSNGENNYQTPGQLISELNGDFITIPKLDKTLEVTDTNTITLSDKEKLISIDADNCGLFIITADGYTRIGATLTDSQTITLDEAIVGAQKIQVKGQLDPSLALIPRVNAEIAVNMSANIAALNSSVASMGQQIQQLENTVDLAIVTAI